MNSKFAKISSRENISNSLFAKFSSRENKVLYSRWQEYFDELFNVTNLRKEPDKCDQAEGSMPRIIAVQ